MNKNKFWFSILIIELIFLSYLVGAETYRFTPVKEQLLNETPREVLINNINTVAENVSNSYEYILNRFDCTQFSQTLVKRLSEVGIISYCVTGYMWEYKNNGEKWRKLRHTWVELNLTGELIGIEATGGYIIPANEYNENYVKIKRGVCA